MLIKIPPAQRAGRRRMHNGSQLNARSRHARDNKRLKFIRKKTLRRFIQKSTARSCRRSATLSSRWRSNAKWICVQLLFTFFITTTYRGLIEACRSGVQWGRKREKGKTTWKCVTKLFQCKWRQETRMKTKAGKLCHRCDAKRIANSWEMWGNGRMHSWVMGMHSHLKMSLHSGCAPRRAFLVACALHGSSMMHAFGPSSFRICRSAIDSWIADTESSLL